MKTLESKKRILTLLKAKKAKLGLLDLFYFCKYILGYKDVCEQPHRGMCDFIDRDEARRILILEPRGSFKSTIITVGYTILSIIRNPDIRILLDSEDLSISKKFLSEIKAHFEHNETLRDLYGDYVGNKWTETEIIVSKRELIFKEPTVLTAGIETTRVGMHVDLIIGDDYHSQQNVNTPEQLEKVKEHWQLNQSILEPEGKEIIIGTRWDMGDLYGHILEVEEARKKEGRSKFEVRCMDAEDDGNGGLYFPTRLTKEFLADKQIELGSRIYNMQYRNNPLDQSSILFKKEWIKFYGRYAPENLLITATLDPAISKKDESCFSNINVVGTDTNGFIYILDNIRFRALPDEIINKIFMMQNKWNPVEFGIETVAYQKALKYWAWERMRNSGVFFNVKELKTETDVSKDMRIKALEPYVESGTIQYPGTGPHSLVDGIYDLYEEMIQYPVGKYKDALDSLAYQLQLYTPARPIKPKKVYQRDFKTVMETERKGRLRRDRNKIPVLGRQRAYIAKNSYFSGKIIREVVR